MPSRRDFLRGVRRDDLMLRPGSLECLRSLVQASDEPTRWCPHDPHPKQAAFLAVTGLEALYGGAAGGGKSDALLMAALQCVDVPGYSGILFRRTYTDLALPGAIMDRAHEWLAGTAAHWNDRDKVWTFPSGARLAFGYMDGPRDHLRYKSAEFQFVGFDELTQFESKQYTYLFSRLRRTTETQHIPLRMRGATNPGDIGHEWVGERFGIIGNDPEAKARVFVPALLEDNPSIDQESYETALAELDPVTLAQLRWGQWIRDSSGLVFHCFRDEKNIVPALPDLPDDERWMRVLGCDFGVVDPTAFVELAFAEHDRRVFVTRSEQWQDMSPSEAAEEAIRWEKSAGGYDAIVGDVGGMGKGYQSEWQKRFYLPMKAAQKNDKLGYVKLLNGDLHHGLALLTAGNEDLAKCIKSLAWKDETHRAEHPGLPNHLTDAWLYGWREARHWAWEEREEKPATPEARARKEAAERKDRVKRRVARAKASEDNDEWILGRN